MPNPAYDADHRRHRADWNQLIQAGHAPTCPRCHRPILPGQPWQLGHTVDLVHGGNPKHRRPEHERCNLEAGAALATANPPHSRPW